MQSEIEKFYAQRQRVADELALEEQMKLIVEGDRLRQIEEKIKKDNMKELDAKSLGAVAENIDINAVISTYNPFQSQECYNFVQIMNSDCNNATCKTKNVFYGMLVDAIGAFNNVNENFNLEKYLEAEKVFDATKWKPEHFKNLEHLNK